MNSKKCKIRKNEDKYAHEKEPGKTITIRALN